MIRRDLVIDIHGDQRVLDGGIHLSINGPLTVNELRCIDVYMQLHEGELRERWEVADTPEQLIIPFSEWTRGWFDQQLKERD